MTTAPKFSTETAAKILLILGAALLIYWQPLGKSFPLKASDGVFVITICAWALILNRERLHELKGPHVWFIVALLASVLWATLVAYTQHHLGMSRQGLILLGRLVGCIALFLATYNFILRDNDFRSRISWALLSPLALFPAMLIPRVSPTMWDGDGRFQGLTVNANSAAVGFLIGFALAYTMAAYEVGLKRSSRALAFGSIAFGMVLLILWTQSRAYLLAAFASSALGAALVAAQFGLPRLKVATSVVLTFGVIVAGIFVLAPRAFTDAFLARVSPVYRTLTSQTPADQTSASPGPRSKEAAERFLLGIRPRIEEDPRAMGIGYYSNLLRTNFFGLGLNYETKFTIYIPLTGEHHGPNTILDLPVYGGFGAVLSVAYLAFLVARRTKQRLAMPNAGSARYAIAAVTALAGIWGAAFLVGSPLFDYHFWILTAIALA